MGNAGQEPLIFIHGSGDSTRRWQQVVSLLDLGERRAICLDLPGHGARAHESMETLVSVNAYADTVRQQMDAAGMDEAILVGHSLGSAIALRLALDARARVRGLVLIGSGSRLRVLPALLEAARSRPAEALRDIIILGHAPGHEAMAEAYAAEAEPRAPEALYRDLSACNTFDATDRLAEVSQPVLILVGAQDRLTPPKYATFLAEHMPQATIEIIAGAGHYLMHEAPEEVASALSQWLAH